MAYSTHSLIISTITIYLTLMITTISGSDIHDILPDYGLPVGILPDAVESYTISKLDNTFTVKLTHPCYVKFDDQTVYYSQKIQGKMTYGSIFDVTGIQAKQLFLWLSVTGMEVVDGDSGMIEFHVGVLSKKLPADMFRVVPDCKSKACPHDDQVYDS